MSMILWHISEAKLSAYRTPERGGKAAASNTGRSDDDDDIAPPPKSEAGKRDFSDARKKNGVGTLENIFRMLSGGGR